jgi:CsoR family transcriptional regulator, copper-sensing transcriptional repressor
LPPHTPHLMTGTKKTKKNLPIPPTEEDLIDYEHDHSHDTHSHLGSTHPHVHSQESLRRIVNRLSRIEGHVRGVKSMVLQNSPCPDVLLQIAAVRGALDRVARIVLDEHLSECISRAAREGNMEEEIEQLKAALDRFFP